MPNNKENIYIYDCMYVYTRNTSNFIVHKKLHRWDREHLLYWKSLSIAKITQIKDEQ